MRRGGPGRPVALVLVPLLLAAAGCAMALPVRPTSIASGAVGGTAPVHPGALRLYRESKIQQ